MRPSDEQDLFINAGNYLRNVGVDNVIFGYHQKELKILLQQPFAEGKWTLTGGYIEKTETLDEAAQRIAYFRTGLKDIYLQQFRSFGTPARSKDPSFTAGRLSTITGVPVPEDAWVFDYFVSIGFYTLTEFSKVEVRKAAFEAECRWWPMAGLPPLMFDHQEIIAEALQALRLHIAHYPIGYELLEEKFTLPEIHNLYETILGKQLDIRNFTKRLMATGIITRLNEQKRIGAHRSPFLYRFNKETYQAGLKSGVDLVF